MVTVNAIDYDPVVGRFFSPDPFVQIPDFTQSYNRYSYCMNNPVMYNDPGGEIYGQYALPEITVVAESATTATVYTRVSPNSPYIPPAPYKYYSPTLYRLFPLLKL